MICFKYLCAASESILLPVALAAALSTQRLLAQLDVTGLETRGTFLLLQKRALLQGEKALVG